MSVLWTIDYSRRPVTLRASIKILFLGLENTNPDERRRSVERTAGAQLAWWNRQREDVRVYRRPYRVTFDVRAIRHLPPAPSELVASGAMQPTWQHSGRRLLVRWLQNQLRYRFGLGAVVVGGGGTWGAADNHIA